MRKVVIFLVVLFTFKAAFICMNQKGEEIEFVMADQAITNQFADSKPDIIPDPMVGFPIY